MSARLYICLFILSVFIRSNCSLNDSNQHESDDKFEGLYSIDDKVEILNSKNFKESLYYQQHAWVVEFYNSWCGFCQRFAPKWIDFAADVNIWRHVVRIGAIDCANDANNDICRDFEVMSYPTIRYFHENYAEKSGSIGDRMEKGVDPKEMRETLVSRLQQEQEAGRGLSFPSLTIHDFHTLVDVWFRIPNNIKVTFLIFESSNSTTGGEVILDLDNVFGIRILRVNSNSKISKIVQVNRYPTLIALERNLTIIPLTPKEASRETLRQAILIYLKSNKFTILPSVLEMIGGESSISDTKKNTPNASNQNTDVVYQADLETALRYTLHHEITNHKSITGERLSALRNYIKVINKYFPFTANGRIFMNDLKKTIDQGDTWEGKDLANVIEKLESNYSPVYSTMKEWIGCKGSSPQLRGFTCGLWMMFHTLSVNAAITNNYDFATEGKVILEAIHGYVKYFFGCADCSEHFQSMAKRLKLFDVFTLERSVIWLWFAHNEVNKRLAGDPTEDMIYPKRQFPTVEICQSCHQQNGNWNINATYDFLLNMYGAKQISLLDVNLSLGSTERMEAADGV